MRVRCRCLNVTLFLASAEPYDDVKHHAAWSRAMSAVRKVDSVATVGFLVAPLGVGGVKPVRLLPLC